MCLASFALMQSIRNTQHLGKANLLKVKRQQKRDLCATRLIKSLESVCLNSLHVTRARNHTQQNPNNFHTPQTHRMSLIIIQKKTINASERRLLFATSIIKSVRIITAFLVRYLMNALLSWQLDSHSRFLFPSTTLSEAFLYLCPSRGCPSRIRTHFHWFGWKAAYSWVFTCFYRIIKPHLTRLIWLSFQSHNCWILIAIL